MPKAPEFRRCFPNCTGCWHHTNAAFCPEQPVLAPLCRSVALQMHPQLFSCCSSVKFWIRSSHFKLACHVAPPVAPDLRGASQQHRFRVRSSLQMRWISAAACVSRGAACLLVSVVT